jgi:hypothetical protein
MLPERSTTDGRKQHVRSLLDFLVIHEDTKKKAGDQEKNPTACCCLKTGKRDTCT